MAEPRRWSAQFIGMLESLRMGAQFQQGRRYARAGHVRHLTISSSLVSALVLDENGVGHRTKIAVRSFGAADWSRIERELAGQAYYAAKLLAGQFPDDIDRVFAGFGLALFPESIAEIAMDCACPSWQVPCGHLTALAYAMADAFDTDPFTILAWRGRGRDELLDHLRELRHAPTAAGSSTAGPSPADPSAPGPVGPPEPVSPAAFWTAGPRVRPAPRTPGGVHRPDALLDQLDPLGVAAGRDHVVDLLRPVYGTIVDGGDGGTDDRG